VKQNYARSKQFISGESKLYALTTIYKRSNKVMRAQNDISAVKANYARSQRFISGETKLYALKTIYKRSNKIMRAQNDL